MQRGRWSCLIIVPSRRFIPACSYLPWKPVHNFFPHFFSSIIIIFFFTGKKITWLPSSVKDLLVALKGTDQNTTFLVEIQFSICLVLQKSETQIPFSTFCGKLNFLFFGSHSKTRRLQKIRIGVFLSRYLKTLQTFICSSFLEMLLFPTFPRILKSFRQIPRMPNLWPCSAFA